MVKREENRRLKIAEMKSLALSKGGKCISNEYINSMYKLKWQCTNGHTWLSTPSNVKRGYWCRLCFEDKRKVTLQDMQLIAKNRGGYCLSEEFINTSLKMKWQCKKGHIWEATANNIRSNHWCLKCAGIERKSIDDMHLLAKQRGGKCLSTTYTQNKEKLEWQCANNHKWKAVPGQIRRGRWCPTCNSFSNLRETICREAIEVITGYKFPSSRPSWLVSVDGSRLQLDGYSEDLGLAFEHQGEQHYKKVEIFHNAKRTLNYQKKIDRRKRYLCKEKSIEIIEIPYFIPTKEIPTFIYKELSKKCPIFCIKKARLEKLDLSFNKVNELKLHAKKMRGECLSDVYLGYKTKIAWKCENGHVWESSPGHVIGRGQWCPRCAGLRVLLEDMEKLAEQRQGKCLSKEYDGGMSELKWKCKKGHIFFRKPSSIKAGNWCSECSGWGVKSIGDMHALAKVKGGQCLSKKYRNCHSKLEWKCQKGHVWKAVPSSVQSGSWCPKCSRWGTIEEMEKIAFDRGGKCLSDVYTGSNNKLEWKCQKNHIWKMTPKAIKFGSWCRICNKEKAQIQKLNIIKEIAVSKGGECLSKKFLRTDLKLDFRCGNGHLWKTTPGRIKRGNWCPFCCKKRS